MAILNVLRGMSGSTQVPMGTPIRPAVSMGANRRQSAARQIDRQRRQVAQHRTGGRQLGGDQGLDSLQPHGQARQRRSKSGQAIDETTHQRASQNEGQRRPVPGLWACPCPVLGLFLEVALFNTISWR